ncbi:DUF5994 family protein [Rugosimonospora acidiphila]|uniref:DUF5994 family protein n=2 Tax=Rugosimonospora acidiphila TaxID=556531 RepID=A0ABP9RSN3_9ACTN
MHSTADRKTWMSTADPVTPRLRLHDDLTARTILDGAWWPYSRTTVTELTNLVIALDARHLPVTRIMLNAAAWGEHPRRIGVAGRTIRLGWFTTLEACLLIATTNTNQRLDLLVIPPRVPAKIAAAAMATAADKDNTTRAEAIMAAVSPQRRFSLPRPEDIWESEGGGINGHRTGTRS